MNRAEALFGWREGALACYLGLTSSAGRDSGWIVTGDRAERRSGIAWSSEGEWSTFKSVRGAEAGNPTLTFDRDSARIDCGPAARAAWRGLQQIGQRLLENPPESMREHE